MSRAWTLVAIVLLLAGGLVSLPDAEGAHAWGHRFVIFGRILDADGNPAQLIEVGLSSQTREAASASPQVLAARPDWVSERVNPWDPFMLVRTDCQGVYYAQQQEPHPADHRLDGGRLHIHNAEHATNGWYSVSTAYGEHSARADRDAQRATANIWLDETVEPNEQCADAVDWRTQYVVFGTLQEDRGNTRTDLTFESGIEVTLQTTDGPRNMTVETNVAAQYFAIFDNVSVEDGARITAKWGDEERQGQVNTEFRVTNVDIIPRDSLLDSTGVRVFFGLIGAAILIGVLFWVVQRVKDRRSVEKARETSTRKRARR